MATIDERERNLANATETLGQFYCEVEAFLGILYAEMQRNEFSAKAERLRSRTISTKNLSRRLLATAMVVYGKHIEDEPDAGDDDENEGDEEDVEPTKLGKKELQITPDLRVPFIHLALFEPTAIPTAKNSGHPTLYVGAIGNMSFVDKKTGKPASPELPVMALVNLAAIHLKPTHKKDDPIRQPVWKPAQMKKFKLVANLVELESFRLLELDSQEKIRGIAEKLAAYANT